MLTNYKEYIMTRDLLIENGTVPDVDSKTIIANLEALADSLEAEIDKIFAVAQAQITSHVRISMRNNQGTWNKLKNWWQTTWHGKDRETIESTSVQNLRMELSGLISLHEQQVLNELMDIMEAGPINQALAQMAPMLQNLQLQIKTRVRSAITSVAKKLSAQAAQAAQSGPSTPPPTPSSNNVPSSGPSTPGQGPNTASTTPGQAPNFGSHSTSTGNAGTDPDFGSHSTSTKNSPWSPADVDASKPSQKAPGGHDPNGLTGQPADDSKSADFDDLDAAMNRPNSLAGSKVDEPGNGEEKDDNTSNTTEPEADAIDMGAPVTSKRRRRKDVAPKITLGPEDNKSGEEDESPQEPPAPEAEPDKAPPESSLSAQIAAMKDRLKNRKSPLDDDDDDDIGTTPSPQTPTASEPQTVPDDDDDEEYGKFGSDVPQVTVGRESNGAFPTTGWKEKIPYAIEGIQNPGIEKLAKHLMKPKGSTGKQQAKFVRFMTQLVGQNPEAKKILAMPDLADRYEEIAKKVDHPEDMGRIANQLQFANLYPAKENPEGFYNNLKNILANQGIMNGVNMSTKKQNKSGSKKMRAESIQQMKENYIHHLRETATAKNKSAMNLAHLSFSEQVQAYRRAMNQS